MDLSFRLDRIRLGQVRTKGCHAAKNCCAERGRAADSRVLVIGQEQCHILGWVERCILGNRDRLTNSVLVGGRTKRQAVCVIHVRADRADHFELADPHATAGEPGDTNPAAVADPGASNQQSGRGSLALDVRLDVDAQRPGRVRRHPQREV